MAERAFLRTLRGGCQVPVAAFCKVEGEAISIRGLVSDRDGKRIFMEEIEGPSWMAEELGTELAERIMEKGGRKVLEDI